ncbi:MAG: protein YgfX [Acidobacteriota bacterium]
MKAPASIRVALRPSRLITSWLAGIHGATLLPLWWSALPVWASLVVTIAVAVHGAWAIRRFGRLQSPHSVTGVALRPGVDCTLTTRNGAEFSGPVHPSTLVVGSLIVLALKISAKPLLQRTVIAPDMLAEEDFRQLRVGLKWGRPQASEGSQA